MECRWQMTDNGWRTACGVKGRLHRGYKYCPYCGKEMKLNWKRKEENFENLFKDTFNRTMEILGYTTKKGE